MDFTKLRVCTMKSKLGVGTYPNETIERIIGAQHFRELRRIYYNYANIDYTDDVKKAINLTHPIPKPGTSKEMEELNNCEMTANMHNESRVKMFAQEKKREKIKRMNKRIGDALSRGQMQAVNHGKMYYKEETL